MIIKKIINIVSLIVSGVYGFSMLLILDMVNHKVNFTPIFMYTNNKGILRGLISFIIYILFIFFLSLIAKLKDKKQINKFILMNVVIFIIGLVLFIWIGAIFLIDTDSGP